MAEYADPDQTTCSAKFDLGLYCLLNPDCPTAFVPAKTRKIIFIGVWLFPLQQAKLFIFVAGRLGIVAELSFGTELHG